MHLARLLKGATLATSALAAVAVVFIIAVAPGCGNDAVGVDACRRIEEARCYRAVECAIPLSTPVHRGDDVTACVDFYKDECLHGLASKNDPGGPKVTACVTAITGGFCSVVVAPETDPACAFLIPAAQVVDAGADAAAAAAVDAGTDAADAADGT